MIRVFFLLMCFNIATIQSLQGCGNSLEQKREKKDTKKGTTSESRCVIILSSKLGHSPRALFRSCKSFKTAPFVVSKNRKGVNKQGQFHCKRQTVGKRCLLVCSRHGNCSHDVHAACMGNCSWHRYYLGKVLHDP